MLGALVVLGALVLRLARVERPSVDPLGTYAGGRVTVNRVRLGRTVLGWTVLCQGHEVLGSRGQDPPRAVAVGDGVVAVSLGGAPRAGVGVVRATDCATARVPGTDARSLALRDGRPWPGAADGGRAVDLGTLRWVRGPGR